VRQRVRKSTRKSELSRVLTGYHIYNDLHESSLAQLNGTPFQLKDGDILSFILLFETPRLSTFDIVSYPHFSIYNKVLLFLLHPSSEPDESEGWKPLSVLLHLRKPGREGCKKKGN